MASVSIVKWLLAHGQQISRTDQHVAPLDYQIRQNQRKWAGKAVYSTILIFEVSLRAQQLLPNYGFILNMRRSYNC